LLLYRFGALDVNIMNSYGSHNVFSSGSGALALLSGIVTGLLLLAGYAVFYRGGNDDFTDPGFQARITRFTALAIATFIVGGKVLSPQFLIWLLPLMPLVAGRDRRLVLSLFTGVLLLTQWEFPARYWNLYMLETDMIVLVTARNFLLAVLVVVLLVGGRRTAPAGQLTPAAVTRQPAVMAVPSTVTCAVAGSTPEPEPSLNDETIVVDVVLMTPVGWLLEMTGTVASTLMYHVATLQL